MNIRERFLAWRDEKLADAAFQDWAATFPLTRSLARKRAARLFEITTGFVYSQILFACVQLEIFYLLQPAPLSPDAVAQKIGLSKNGADRLLRAAASLELLSKRSGGRYGLGELGAALLGNPSVFAMIRHHAALYEDLRDPVDLLRERSGDTHLARFWDYAGADDAEKNQNSDAAIYSDLMAQTQALIASEILHAYSFAKHRHLLDVGGGAGAFLTVAKKSYPSLKATLCDLPGVVQIARENFAQKGIDAEAFECNFQQQPLPKGADIITLIRILHDHDDHVVRALLSAVHETLPEDGTLLVAEPMADTPGVAPMGEAYFGMYLWAMGSGRPRSFCELAGFLENAGFASAKLIPTRRPILTQLIVAKKHL